MVEIPATEGNVRLAKAVNRRIAADASMISAKSAMLKFGGLSALALAIGGGVGLAFLGYARTLDATASSDKIASAISEALGKVTLNAKLGEEATVRLDAKGAVVGIDPHASVAVKGTIALDPNAKVQVNGVVQASVPRPTEQQLGPFNSPQAAQGRRVHTSFTVFKSIDHSGGKVVTGYNFVGDETVPVRQYCYYSTEQSGAVSVQVELAIDAVYKDPKSTIKMNTKEAAQNCIWFDGAPTRYW